MSPVEPSKGVHNTPIVPWSTLRVILQREAVENYSQLWIVHIF